jgi:hypothetical protein
LPQDEDDTIISTPTPKKAEVKTVAPAPRSKTDFLSNVIAGKDEKIMPNKIDLKEIHQEPKAKSEPDLSFFDGVKRYEAPKRPNQAPARP